MALLLVLRTRNNTDGNKLVIFSGIASYYGDNYIVLKSMEKQSGLSELSIISWASAVEGCLLSGVPLYMVSIGRVVELR